MKLFVVACLALAPLTSGCVEYASPPYAHVVLSASGPSQMVSSGGYAPQSVPDIPSVPGQRVDADTIRRALDGYGTWSQDPTYGSIWMPAPEMVGQSFVPYGTQGHWLLSDSGWYWQSELRFGWLTFHYGRWVTVNQQWAWVPGGMFAPAWVDWRVGNGYVGWAPLPPLGATYAAPYAFCSYGSLWANDLWARVVYGAGAASIYGATQTVPPSYGINGAVYAWGPTPVTVQGSAPPALVPIANAWQGETNPRAGTPAGVTTGSPAGRPVGALAFTTNSGTVVPAAHPNVAGLGGGPAFQPTGANLPSPPRPGFGAEGAVVNTASAGQHVPEAMAWTPAPVAGTLPHIPGNAPVVANARPYETPTVTYNPDVVGTGRYRTSDTVVIGSSVPSAPIRETVSLGTAAPNYGGGSFSPQYNAPSQPSYAAPSYNAPAYSAPSYNPTPRYGGGGGYVAPTSAYGGGYNAAAPSYATPSYGGSYNAPTAHYSAPAPAFAPAYGGGYATPTAHYSAPVQSYHPASYGGGYRGFHR